MMQKDLIAFIVEQYRRFGPVFRVRAFNQEIVIMAGPEANAFVTQEGADKFSSRATWYAFGESLGAGENMQALDGEPHLRMRKVVKRGYSPTTLMSDIPLLIAIEQRIIDQWQAGAELPALHLFRLIVTEQLGRVLANHAPGDDLSAIINSTRTRLKVYVAKQSPSLMLLLPSYRRARRRNIELAHEILAEHRATTRKEPDLVDDLLAAHENEQHKDILGGEGQLAYAALGPFIAGLDTVANECAFMLYELLSHPDVLEQCREEADQLFSNGIPEHAQFRTTGALHYAMMETLRLHSIAPAVTRTAAKTFEFAGYQIKEGQQIIIASTASHFLPEVFADPYKFDITRYSEPRKEHRKRGAYAPFGIGTHTCLGAGAAEAQIVLVMATLLHLVCLEWACSPTKLRLLKSEPNPTFGLTFRVRIAERRHKAKV